MRYLILILFLSSCSAEWHLRKAIKKNPEYGKPKIKYELVLYRDTIRDTIVVPHHDFSFNLDSLCNVVDSFNMVYSDSILTIYGKLDSLGKMKFKGKVKEKLIPFEVIVHDTIKVAVECPPAITINSGYPKWYLWLFIFIFALFVFYNVKR